MQVYEITKNWIPGLPENPYANGVDAYEGVIGHSTANDNDSDEDERDYEARTWKDAFVHCFVDFDSITEVANPIYRAWGAGVQANPRFVHVELCQTTDPVKFAESFDRWTYVLAYYLHRRGLGVRDAQTLWSHAEVSQFLGGTDHTDPIGYLARFNKTWNDVIVEVIAKYNAMDAQVQPAPQPIITPSPQPQPQSVQPQVVIIRPVLREGSFGDSVFQLQTLLRDEGFYAGEIDGKFGPITKNGVRGYQESRSLDVDGVVGNNTWTSLISRSPAKIHFDQMTVLRMGSSGTAVVDLQNRLKAKGYNCGASDGEFGPMTLGQVIAFQTSRGLARDGVVGPMTWEKLYN